MLILAVDTSGKNGSIALVQFEAQFKVQFEAAESRTVELVALEGGTFSAQLVPQISALLKKHNFRKQDIEGFAVVSGPGSFTGLRVGLAAIKGLAEGLHKPIAAISMLEAIARAAGTQGKVLAAMDAGRGNVYWGEYMIRDSRVQLIKQQVLSAEEFLNLATGQPIVSFDSQITDRARENNGTVILIDAPRADSVARIGWEKLHVGEAIPAEALDADYISRSGAELEKLGPRPL